MREAISGCVMTFNNEDKIRRCLESLKWCDEIVVVDSLSTDSTLEICREYTDQIHYQKFLGFVGQREFTRTKCHFPWILMLDSDEEVSADLQRDIEAEMDNHDGVYMGYRFPRQVYYLGKWIRHGNWYPDYKLRFFRRELGKAVGEEPHDKIKVDGPVKTFKSPLYHYTYDGVADQISTLNHFSGISAEQKCLEGKSFHWWDFVIRPLIRFLRGYFLKLGILDGRQGLLIALTDSYGVAVKYAKLWEMELKEKDKRKSSIESL